MRILQRLEARMAEMPRLATFLVFVCTLVLIGAAALFISRPSQYGQASVSSAAVATSSQRTSLDGYINVSTTTYKYGNLVFQVIGNNFDLSTLRIFQNGRLALSEDGTSFYALGSSCPWDASTTNCDPDSAPAFGVDINGDGNKDFVFADMQGGTGVYVNYYVFELPNGGTVKELASLKEISGGAVFKDLSHKGSLNVKLTDATFDCWGTDCADTRGSGGKIILSWNTATQTYTPDLELMRTPAPSQAAITKKVNFYRNTNDWCVTVPTSSGPASKCSVPWSYALSLIYSGHATTALHYLDQVWPAIANYPYSGEHFASEEDFKNQFLTQLEQSPYYSAVLSLNGGRIF